LGVDVVGRDVVAQFLSLYALEQQLLIDPLELVLVLHTADLLEFLTLPLHILDDLLVLYLLLGEFQLLHVRGMRQVLL
jgi:hypothetical protein